MITLVSLSLPFIFISHLLPLTWTSSEKYRVETFSSLRRVRETKKRSSRTLIVSPKTLTDNYRQLPVINFSKRERVSNNRFWNETKRVKKSFKQLWENGCAWQPSGIVPRQKYAHGRTRTDSLKWLKAIRVTMWAMGKNVVNHCFIEQRWLALL